MRMSHGAGGVASSGSGKWFGSPLSKEIEYKMHYNTRIIRYTLPTGRSLLAECLQCVQINVNEVQNFNVTLGRIRNELLATFCLFIVCYKRLAHILDAGTLFAANSSHFHEIVYAFQRTVLQKLFVEDCRRRAAASKRAVRRRLL